MVCDIYRILWVSRSDKKVYKSKGCSWMRKNRWTKSVSENIPWEHLLLFIYFLFTKTSFTLRLMTLPQYSAWEKCNNSKLSLSLFECIVPLCQTSVSHNLWLCEHFMPIDDKIDGWSMRYIGKCSQFLLIIQCNSIRTV